MHRLGAALAAAVGAGPVDVTLSLRDANGAERARYRLAGTVAGGALRVDRVSASLRDVSWPVLTRYLANPLAELSTALFPPPVLTVRAESAELAAELRRHVESSFPGACHAAGPILRCRVPGRPDQLGELLLQIARERALGDLHATP